MRHLCISLGTQNVSIIKDISLFSPFPLSRFPLSRFHLPPHPCPTHLCKQLPTMHFLFLSLSDTFAQDFFLTYPAFMSISDLCDELRKTYKGKVSTVQQTTPTSSSSTTTATTPEEDQNKLRKRRLTLPTAPSSSPSPCPGARYSPRLALALAWPSLTLALILSLAVSLALALALAEISLHFMWPALSHIHVPLHIIVILQSSKRCVYMAQDSKRRISERRDISQTLERATRFLTKGRPDSATDRTHIFSSDLHQELQHHQLLLLPLPCHR